ncbi:hypothetical protein [Actinoplanes regularis]|uniref:hypothetical protein n=1 Tax=Actinoplanes regularis TaxID=52697 RepID=UPI0019455BD3|nr:hypothetical protein [Actinoplanes regularis]GIE88361.1 hypothetical protein Are01nite_48410 [Actinoplanes regularis]
MTRTLMVGIGLAAGATIGAVPALASSGGTGSTTAVHARSGWPDVDVDVDRNYGSPYRDVDVNVDRNYRAVRPWRPRYRDVDVDVDRNYGSPYRNVDVDYNRYRGARPWRPGYRDVDVDVDRNYGSPYRNVDVDVDRNYRAGRPWRWSEGN